MKFNINFYHCINHKKFKLSYFRSSGVPTNTFFWNKDRQRRETATMTKNIYRESQKVTYLTPDGISFVSPVINDTSRREVPGINH